MSPMEEEDVDVDPLCKVDDEYEIDTYVSCFTDNYEFIRAPKRMEMYNQTAVRDCLCSVDNFCSNIGMCTTIIYNLPYFKNDCSLIVNSKDPGYSTSANAPIFCRSNLNSLALTCCDFNITLAPNGDHSGGWPTRKPTIPKVTKSPIIPSTSQNSNNTTTVFVDASRETLIVVGLVAGFCAFLLGAVSVFMIGRRRQLQRNTLNNNNNNNNNGRFSNHFTPQRLSGIFGAVMTAELVESTFSTNNDRDPKPEDDDAMTVEEEEEEDNNNNNDSNYSDRFDRRSRSNNRRKIKYNENGNDDNNNNNDDDDDDDDDSTEGDDFEATLLAVKNLCAGAEDSLYESKFPSAPHVLSSHRALESSYKINQDDCKVSPDIIANGTQQEEDDSIHLPPTTTTTSSNCSKSFILDVSASSGSPSLLNENMSSLLESSETPSSSIISPSPTAPNVEICYHPIHCLHGKSASAPPEQLVRESFSSNLSTHSSDTAVVGTDVNIISSSVRNSSTTTPGKHKGLVALYIIAEELSKISEENRTGIEILRRRVSTATTAKGFMIALSQICGADAVKSVAEKLKADGLSKEQIEIAQSQLREKFSGSRLLTTPAPPAAASWSRMMALNKEQTSDHDVQNLPFPPTSNPEMELLPEAPTHRLSIHSEATDLVPELV